MVKDDTGEFKAGIIIMRECVSVRALRVDRRSHLGANLGGVSVEVLEHAGGDALTLAEQTEEKVLGADVVVAELASLLEGELEHALGAGGEGDLDSHETGTATDDLLNLDARLLQADA